MFFISYTGLLRGPCGTHKGAARHPYGHERELTQPVFAKIPHGRRMWPHGARMDPSRFSHGLFTGCLRSLNPYGARRLIMHALKLYGPRTGRQNSYGAARVPYGPREWTDDVCSKQPGNSPYGARECDVTGAWSAGRNFSLMLFSWSHQAYGPRTASDSCTLTFLSNYKLQNYRGARVVPARAS